MNAPMLALAGGLVLAGMHAVTPALRRAPARHQAVISSITGGMGLAYVFLYLLFELAEEGAAKLHAALPLGPGPLETLFVLLLSAVTASYVVQARLQQSPNLRDDHRGFALCFLAYNLLAGAGLLEEAPWGATNLALYVVALGLHMITNDLFLQHLSPGDHTRPWRIALATSPGIGVAGAIALSPPEGVLYAALTVIAGGTIINVVRREIPAPESFKPVAFVAGVASYTVLVLGTWRF